MLVAAMLLDVGIANGGKIFVVAICCDSTANDRERLFNSLAKS